MKFHMAEMMTPVPNLMPLAHAAEEYGYDGYIIADSLLYPRESSTRYSYTAEGGREFLENKPVLESFVHAAAIAACTTRIEITTSVVKLPMRHPVYAAKLATSLAVLSNNRFNFGVGLSVWPEDYEAMGLSYENRGKRLDECIDIVRGLGRGDYFEYHGKFYDFPSLKLNPVPDAPLPIIVGGHSETALRRAARYDGWSCAGNLARPVADYVKNIADLRREMNATGSYRVFQHEFSPTVTRDDIRQREEAGVTDLILHLRNVYTLAPDREPLQSKLDRFRRFADDVVHRL